MPQNQKESLKINKLDFSFHFYLNESLEVK